MDAPQSARLSEVLQAGNKHEVAFIKDTFNLPKLKEMKSVQSNQILGAILQQASVLAGIKDGIQDAVKNDLKDLIYSRFGNLALEEIAYAFKLERQRIYDCKTEHFQFFSTEYVADILNKYTAWKRNKMREKNISSDKEVEAPRQLTDEAKQAEYYLDILNSFEYFKKYEELRAGDTRFYVDFFKRGFFPKHTKAYREQIDQRVYEVLKNEQLQAPNRALYREIKSIIQQEQTEATRFKLIAQSIIISDYYRVLIQGDKNILNEIKKTESK